MKIFAGVMELVDMTDSKSVAEMRGGSSPPTGTKYVVFQQLIMKGQLKSWPFFMPLIHALGPVDL
jgi:hypothetical protein